METISEFDLYVGGGLQSVPRLDRARPCIGLGRGVPSAPHRRSVRAFSNARAAERNCHARDVDFPGHRSPVLRRLLLNLTIKPRPVGHRLWYRYKTPGITFGPRNNGCAVISRLTFG